MHGPLARVLGRVGLDEETNKAREDISQVYQGHHIQAVHVVAGDIAINRDFGDVGTEELASGLKHKKRQ